MIHLPQVGVSLRRYAKRGPLSLLSSAVGGHLRGAAGELWHLGSLLAPILPRG